MKTEGKEKKKSKKTESCQPCPSISRIKSSSALSVLLDFAFFACAAAPLATDVAWPACRASLLCFSLANCSNSALLGWRCGSMSTDGAKATATCAWGSCFTGAGAGADLEDGWLACVFFAASSGGIYGPCTGASGGRLGPCRRPRPSYMTMTLTMMRR
jgi:hypothetical protein